MMMMCIQFGAEGLTNTWEERLSQEERMLKNKKRANKLDLGGPGGGAPNASVETSDGFFLSTWCQKKEKIDSPLFSNSIV